MIAPHGTKKKTKRKERREKSILNEGSKSEKHENTLSRGIRTGDKDTKGGNQKARQGKNKTGGRGKVRETSVAKVLCRKYGPRGQVSK